MIIYLKKYIYTLTEKHKQHLTSVGKIPDGMFNVMIFSVPLSAFQIRVQIIQKKKQWITQALPKKKGANKASAFFSKTW